MTKQLWKLNIVKERLWLLANMLAQQAASMAEIGRGFAIVADESRQISLEIEKIVEQAMFENIEPDLQKIEYTAKKLCYLTLNLSIEANRKGYHGKGAAVCADDIRALSFDLLELAGVEINREPVLYAENALTSISNGTCFLQFFMGKYRFVENISFIMEVLSNGSLEEINGYINPRGKKIPVINLSGISGIEKFDAKSYIIMKTPWADENNMYAIACNKFGPNDIFYTPIGKSLPVPENIVLKDYVREYWESTDENGFLFVDWHKLANRTL